MPRNQETSGQRRAAKAAQRAKEGRSLTGHRPTGQRGQDERDRAALHVGKYHNQKQTEG